MIFRVTFLGTGTSTGVPLIGCQCRVCQSTDTRDKRLRSSILIKVFSPAGQELSLLIDAGPDFRQQMLTYAISTLDGILLTHAHRDHIAGLDDVRAFNFLSSKPVPVYGEQRVLKALRKEFDYAFAGYNFSGLPKMSLFPITCEPFRIRDVGIVPVRATHGRLPILGFRIGPLGYLTDASSIEERELEKFSGVDLFVVSTVQRTPHNTHFSLQEAIDVANRVGSPQSLLTHLSHCLEPHKELAADLPPGMAPAYDGMTVELPFKDNG